METSVSKCNAHELKEALKTDHCQLIDVREPFEWEGKRIEKATSIPLSSLTTQQAMKLDKTKPVYLLCQSGSRAKTAAEKFKNCGFEKLTVIEGGLNAWCDAGYPVIKETHSRAWSMERQVRFTAGLLIVTGILLSLLHPGFLVLSGFVGAGLIFAAVTDTCGMAMLLAKMPWNRPSRKRGNS